MKGTVKVLKKGAKVPTAAQDKAAVKKEAAGAVKDAKTLAGKTQPANTVALGVTGYNGNELLAMSPANLTVARGTTVKFQMSKGSYEAHTATFGPVTPRRSPRRTSARSPRRSRAPRRTRAPSTRASARHDGVAEPGAARQRVLELGRARQGQRVAAAGCQQRQVRHSGTFTYYCMIHPFMRGTVTVQ